MFWEENSFLFFLRHEHSTLAGGSHSSDEQVIPNNIELLLIISGGVVGTRETGEVDERGTTDVVGYRLEGELEGVAE